MSFALLTFLMNASVVILMIEQGGESVDDSLETADNAGQAASNAELSVSDAEVGEPFLILCS